MMKRVLVLLVVALLALTAFTGCSSETPSTSTSSEAPAAESAAPAASDEGTAESAAPAESQDTGSASGSVDLVWVHMSPSAQSEQRAYAGFTAYLEEKGWSWNVTEVNSDGSGDKMATNIEDAVAKGCDAIVVSMADLRASTAALEAANNANIPVFSIDSQYTPGVVCDITSNNYVMSSKVSSYLVDRLGGVGNICALTMAEHHGVRKRGEVLTDVILAENPGIKLLENHNIDYGNFLADSQKTAEDWLAKYGKDIDAIWCGWDEPAMAASDAIKAHGFTRDDMFVTGIDGHEGAVDAIRNGDPLVATCAQGFEIFGVKCADLIQAIIVEGKPQAEVVTTTTIYVDAPLITPTNVPDENTPAYMAVDFYES
jgi:ABC-type sugar transport system substrate-binding protein